MSLESAKMRLEQAVARRDHVQRELEDTCRQLQAVNQKQAEVARKLFMQGGIDIYRSDTADRRLPKDSKREDRQGITKYKSFCRSCKTFQ